VLFSTRGACRQHVKFGDFNISFQNSDENGLQANLGEREVQKKRQCRKMRSFRSLLPFFSSEFFTWLLGQCCNTRRSRHRWRTQIMLTVTSPARQRRTPMSDVGISGVYPRTQTWRGQVQSQTPLLVAPHDIYGLLSAVMPKNRYGLCGAAWHIRPVRRRDSGWIPMCPIPGNIIGICLMDIA
jgi:hypothetical protein